MGGYFCQNHKMMHLPNFKNMTFSIPIFSQLPTPQYTIFNRKAQISSKLGAFYNNLLKIHLMFEFGICLWWKPTDWYTKFCEKAHQKAGIYKYTMSMWTPWSKYGTKNFNFQHFKEKKRKEKKTFDLCIWHQHGVG